MKMLNVLIVEDEDLLRSGLELFIAAQADMRVAGKARNGSYIFPKEIAFKSNFINELQS